jgi:purine-binding chemotaxis protein CheW
MGVREQLLIFSLDGGKYALNLAAVASVIRSVALTPLPNAPEIVLGVFSWHGKIIPALDIRQRFRLPARGIEPGDCLIVARTSRFPAALLADEALGVLEDPGPTLVPGDIVPGMRYVQGVKRVGADIIFIHDLEGFLSLEEEGILDDAMDHYGKI